MAHIDIREMDSFASLRQTIQNRINAVEEALGTKLNETKQFDDSFQMSVPNFKIPDIPLKQTKTGTQILLDSQTQQTKLDGLSTQALFIEETANPMDCTFDFDLYSQSKAENNRLDLFKVDILTEPHAEPQSSTDLMTGQLMDETIEIPDNDKSQDLQTQDLWTQDQITQNTDMNDSRALEDLDFSPVSDEESKTDSDDQFSQDQKFEEKNDLFIKCKEEMMLRDKTVKPKLQQFKSFSQMPIESITADERKTVAVPKPTLLPHPRRRLSPRRPQRFVQPRQQSISPPQVVPIPKAEEMISPPSPTPQKKPRAYAPFKQPRMYGAKIQPKTMPRKKYWTPLFHEE